MNGSSVSISDMHSFVENMDNNGIKISNDIGNIIEMGGDDLSDNLGIDLLSNKPSRPASNTNSTQNVSSYGPIDDIGINSLEPLEAISFDIPANNDGSSLFDPEVVVNNSSGHSMFSMTKLHQGHLLLSHL